MAPERAKSPHLPLTLVKAILGVFAASADRAGEIGTRMQTRQMPNLELIFVKAASRLRALAVGMDAIQRLGLTVVLALALALAGAAQALPLMHDRGGEEIVICSDGGIETIVLDRDGNPVVPMDGCAICPDCLSVGSLDLPGSPGQAFNGAAMSVSATLVPAELPCLSQLRLRPETRGPPPVVHADVDPNAAVAAPRLAELAWTGKRHWNGPILTEARR